MSEGQRFGQYLLLERISAGGMAEIFRAKAHGIRGFEKLLAIKRIQPKYSEDDHFIKMMVDEAKITVRLSHVNIAQIFDLGQIDGMYFIAMEYIDGRDLYHVNKRCRERKEMLPIEAATSIAHDLCAGLDYAHTKRDETNRPLGIIHRDVSPQNVLIAYEGQVKLVDFGIAKHAIRSRDTEAGIIKGKFSYMSPEQAWGDPIDHRTDIFSCGIVLWEMLTGQMLYNESDELRLLDRIRKAEIPEPRSIRRDLPVELNAIVMRALAKHREDRYQTAHDFQAALARFLYTKTPGFSVAKMAGWMRHLFPEMIVEDRSARRKRQTLDLELMSKDEFPTGTEGSLLDGKQTEGNGSAGAPVTDPTIDLDKEPTRIWDRKSSKRRGGKGKGDDELEELSLATGEYQILGREGGSEEAQDADRTEVDVVNPFFEPQGDPADSEAPGALATAQTDPSIVAPPGLEEVSIPAAAAEVPPWEKSEAEFTDVFTPPPSERKKEKPAPESSAGPDIWAATTMPETLDEPAQEENAAPRPIPAPSRMAPIAEPSLRDSLTFGGELDRPRPRRRRPTLLWLIAVLVVIAGAVVIWWGVRSSKEKPAPQARPPTGPTGPKTVAAPVKPALKPAPAPEASTPTAASPTPTPPPTPPPPVKAEAEVLITSEPEQGKVFIDGEARGDVGSWIALPAGKVYRFEVRKPGWRSAAQEIKVTQGRQRLVFALVREPEPPKPKRRARKARRRARRRARLRRRRRRRRRRARARRARARRARTRRAKRPARRVASRVAASAVDKPVAAVEPPKPVAAKPEPTRAAEKTPSPPPPPPPPPKTVELPAHGTLSVNARPWGEVYVDGAKVADQTPVLKLRLRPGVHRVRVYFVSLKRYSGERRVRVTTGKHRILFFRE